MCGCCSPGPPMCCLARGCGPGTETPHAGDSDSWAPQGGLTRWHLCHWCHEDAAGAATHLEQRAGHPPLPARPAAPALWGPVSLGSLDPRPRCPRHCSMSNAVVARGARPRWSSGAGREGRTGGLLHHSQRLLCQSHWQFSLCSGSHSRSCSCSCSCSHSCSCSCSHSCSNCCLRFCSRPCRDWTCPYHHRGPFPMLGR